MTPRAARAQLLKLHEFDLATPDHGAALALLNEEELHRARQFHFERDRLRFVAARAVLRRLLSAETGIPAAGLRFGQGRYGKPMLLDVPELRFNMSHSGGRAVIAVSTQCDVGVDIELTRTTTDLDAVADLAFSASERRDIFSEDASMRTQRLLVAWTRKEACLKATGFGLSHPLESVSCGVDSADRVVQLHSALGVANVLVQTIRISASEVISVASCQPHWSVPTN